MGFFKELGAAIGVGNLDVIVEHEGTGHHGEPIRGVATIAGGNVPQVVHGLALSLVLHWEVYDEESRRDVPRSKVLHRRSLPFQSQVLPGMRLPVPFVLDIPLGVTLAEPHHWHTLNATAEISGGVDVTGEKRLELWPIRPIADTIRAITAATGFSLSGFLDHKAPAGFVRAVLLPGPSHAARFDRIYLDLALNQGMMRVHATLDMKAGVWKTLTGGDEHDYSFAAPDIPTIVAGLVGLIHKHEYNL